MQIAVLKLAGLPLGVYFIPLLLIACQCWCQRNNGVPSMHSENDFLTNTYFLNTLVDRNPFLQCFCISL